MLIFLKSARGLHKNAHFFPIFLNIEYYIFQIFSYIFQQQIGRVRSRAISALADFHCSSMTTWMTPSWNECGLGF